MAEANPKVMEMIEGELKTNPEISNQELFEKAKAMDKDVAKLSPRQFNARYPLQIKRSKSPKKPAARKSPARSPARGAKAGAGAPARATKRARSGGAATAAAATGGAGGQRDKVRGVLLELTRAVANAEGKGDVVDVVVGIDRYVDRVVKAMG